MGVNACVTLGMANINRVAISAHTHCNASNVSVGNREEGFPLNTPGFYIYAAVEMVGARLSEVPCQREFVMYRGLITNNCE